MIKWIKKLENLVYHEGIPDSDDEKVNMTEELENAIMLKNKCMKFE
jgi:hypothetical protein